MEEDVKLENANSEDSPGVKLDRNISVSEFSCNCCYDILVNPTTLNCGHSFCRHCLALWWVSSKKTECPECRDKWEGFPKVNILLRDVIEKLFPDTIKEKYEDLEQNTEIARALQAFNKLCYWCIIGAVGNLNMTSWSTNLCQNGPLKR